MGEEFRSIEYANFLQKNMNAGIKTMCFVVGGAFGFSDEVYKIANLKIAMSKMTFSHQMIRVIFVEQLYRAFTILKGEPYHHE
jgi:23S rRNA (pseudouridine1915-N3)-methyltransferase